MRVAVRLSIYSIKMIFKQSNQPTVIKSSRKPIEIHDLKLTSRFSTSSSPSSVLCYRMNYLWIHILFVFISFIYFCFVFSVTVCYFKNVSSAIQCLKPIIFPPRDSNILHTTFLFLLYINFCKSLPLSSRVSFSLNPECVDLDSLSSFWLSRGTKVLWELLKSTPQVVP